MEERTRRRQSTDPPAPDRSSDAPGLEPLTPHEARHACASYLAAAGLTPKECWRAMGHADMRTTLNIYAKVVPRWEPGAVYLGHADAAS